MPCSRRGLASTLLSFALACDPAASGEPSAAPEASATPSEADADGDPTARADAKAGDAATAPPSTGAAPASGKAAGMGSSPADAPTPEEPEMCGGFGGFACPQGKQCIDDERDDCDPKRGGADCSGICVDPACIEPRRRYSSRSPERCAAIRIACEGGERFFGDACGCGCERVD